MRVLLFADMEGISRITDHRECWPPFEEYWATGRERFTDDVVAAAEGLLEGEATEVVVVNGHGLGWPNMLWERLPAGAVPAGEDWLEGVEAQLQVGFHSRVGTRDGFLSHTMVPGLDVSVDGNPVTESHIWAWEAGVPLLGVAGDDALSPQLDGALEGTPFLAVKRSSSRSETTPSEASPAESAAAIRAFARECSMTRPSTPMLPEGFRVTLTLDPGSVPAAEGQAGLVRVSDSELELEATNWPRDVQPAIEVGMGAALTPYFELQGDLDLSSFAAFEAQDPADLDRVRAFFSDFLDEATGEQERPG